MMSLELSSGPFTHQRKLLIITILLVVSVLITHYFHAVLKIGTVFTHFFYIPVILSALWWQRKGLIVALILSAYLIISHYFFRGDEVTLNDYLRALSFLVISAVVGLLSERLRNTEEALQDSVRRYSAILDHMHDGVAVYQTNDGGEHFIINDINRAAEGIDRVSKAFVAGKDVMEIFPGFIDFGLLDVFRRVWRTGKAERYDCRFYMDNRIQGWRENFVYRLPSGEVVAVYCDRTKEKEAEEGIKQLAAIVESSNDAIISLSPEGIILSWNRAAERIYGYQEEEIVGRSVFCLISPELQEEMTVNLARIKKGEKIEHYEVISIRKDGAPIHVSLALSPITDPQDEVQAISIISRDITRRKKAEEALRKANEELEQKVEIRTLELRRVNEDLRSEVETRKKAEEALRENSEKVKLFAYSVCHDLKSPAISVYGLTRLLKERYVHLLDAKGTALCDQILKASLELGTLVEEINAYINTKESPMQFETVKSDEILHEISEAFEEQFLARDIRCSLGRNGAVLRADRLALIRAFRNLVENALKYGGPGLSEIRLEYETAKDFHVFSVSDNGEGIREDDAGRIFDAFQRGQPCCQIDGAGLGLAIVREIAEKHKGQVYTSPGPEGGVTFFLSISKTL
jgi:PAS domain S-box-containing protein